MTPDDLSYYWEGAREQCEDNKWDEKKQKKVPCPGKYILRVVIVESSDRFSRTTTFSVSSFDSFASFCSCSSHSTSPSGFLIWLFFAVLFAPGALTFHLPVYTAVPGCTLVIILAFSVSQSDHRTCISLKSRLKNQDGALDRCESTREHRAELLSRSK